MWSIESTPITDNNHYYQLAGQIIMHLSKRLGTGSASDLAWVEIRNNYPHSFLFSFELSLKNLSTPCIVGVKYIDRSEDEDQKQKLLTSLIVEIASYYNYKYNRKTKIKSFVKDFARQYAIKRIPSDGPGRPCPSVFTKLCKSAFAKSMCNEAATTDKINILEDVLGYIEKNEPQNADETIDTLFSCLKEEYPLYRYTTSKFSSTSNAATLVCQAEELLSSDSLSSSYGVVDQYMTEADNLILKIKSEIEKQQKKQQPVADQSVVMRSK